MKLAHHFLHYVNISSAATSENEATKQQYQSDAGLSAPGYGSLSRTGQIRDLLTRCTNIAVSSCARQSDQTSRRISHCSLLSVWATGVVYPCKTSSPRYSGTWATGARCTAASIGNSCHCKKMPSKDKHLPAPEDSFNPFLRSSSHLSHLVEIYFFTSKCTRRIVCNNTASVTYWSHCAINNKCMSHTMYGSWRINISELHHLYININFQNFKDENLFQN